MDFTQLGDNISIDDTIDNNDDISENNNDTSNNNAQNSRFSKSTSNFNSKTSKEDTNQKNVLNNSNVNFENNEKLEDNEKENVSLQKKYPRLPYDLSLDIKSIKIIVEDDYNPRDDSLKNQQQQQQQVECIRTRPVRFEFSKQQKPSLSDSDYFKRAKTLTRTISGKLFFKEFRNMDQTGSKDLRLHQAIKQRVSCHKFAKLVRRYQANIDQKDGNEQTPLHICATLGLINYMKILIRRGSNVNLQDMNGFTPLHLSLIGLQLDTCGLLLETKKIDIRITNNENTSVLSYLVRVPVDETNVVLYRRILDLLIENGLDVNMQNKHGETALHSTCLRGNIHAAAFLLERGADCNIRNRLGETSLHYAVRVGNIKLVRLLMENGADPTIRGDDGKTPIDAAEEYQFTEMLDCLQVIIGDAIDATLEKVKQLSVVVNTPRVKVNENVTKEGILLLFQNDSHTTVFAKVNNLSMNLYPSKISAMTLFSIDLTTSLIEKEEGVTISSDEKTLYTFKIMCLKNNMTYYFSITSPDQLESWYQTIFMITETHRKLNDIFEKLKNLSEPRRKRHEAFRHETLKNAYKGTSYLLSIMKYPIVPFEIANKIVANIPMFAATLSEILDIDDDKVIKNLVNFFNYRNLFREFAKAAIFHDISKTKNGETLFREMSLSTRVISVYLEGDEGKEYLRSKVLGLIQSITSVNHSLEVNPKHVVDKSIDIKANEEKICEISQNFLDQVLSSANNYPMVFRELMHFTREKVDQIFPNMTHAVVGGFVFLRYLIPAIVSPLKYSLIQKPLDMMASRVLILVSKLLQSVSNGVEFDGSKEDYMQNFNPFIKRNRLHVNIFFDNLTNPETIGDFMNPKILSNKKELEGIITSTAESLADIISASNNKISFIHSKLEEQFGENKIDKEETNVELEASFKENFLHNIQKIKRQHQISNSPNNNNNNNANIRNSDLLSNFEDNIFHTNLEKVKSDIIMHSLDSPNHDSLFRSFSTDNSPRDSHFLIKDKFINEKSFNFNYTAHNNTNDDNNCVNIIEHCQNNDENNESEPTEVIADLPDNKIESCNLPPNENNNLTIDDGDTDNNANNNSNDVVANIDVQNSKIESKKIVHKNERLSNDCTEFEEELPANGNQTEQSISSEINDAPVILGLQLMDSTCQPSQCEGNSKELIDSKLLLGV